MRAAERNALVTLFAGLAALVVSPLRSQAAGCAATPAAAVLQSMGIVAGAVEAGGFRVRGVLPDAALGRAFVQIESCAHPEYPVIALPLGALSMKQGLPPAALKVADATEPQQMATIPRGSPVNISSADSKIRLQMQGKLLQAAVVGRDVDVEVAALTIDGGARHLHGRLVAANSVEVQP